ncbi:hypothetical protein [Kitasatospora sp. NPDC093679]|uniref:hypothetical protein n=1 Tax=Kitasatospora sp. NPDC093679 TaxID=3154983 RepID=UPI003435CD5B
MIVRRILAGESTEQDVERAQQNFEQWIREEWGGNGDRAVASCLNSPAETAGAEWDALPERDAHAHIWLFTFLCPRSPTPGAGRVDLYPLDVEAAAYRDMGAPVRFISARDRSAVIRSVTA